MVIKRILAIVTTSIACLCLGGASVQAAAPVSGSGTFQVTFVPTGIETADGNTIIDYTFVENTVGIVDGTRIGSGELVIHADGSFNTANSGIFTGSTAGGNLTVTHGSDGLAGVHAEGKDSGSATGPTTFAGTISFKVNFSTT